MNTSPTALLLLNGKIHTLDARPPCATALAIRDGKILYVGDDATARAVLPQVVPENSINLRGACVLPGLTDAHVHLMWFSQGLQQVPAEQPTKQQVLDIVAEFARRKPAGAWITGFGWNHNVWDGRFPTAADLDQVAPEHPVVLAAKSGHACWANSLALRLADITAQTADPPGGAIVRDADGEPTGVLLEEAMDLVDRLLPEPGPQEAAETLRHGIQAAHRAGLTGVHDMDGVACFQGLQVLRQAGQLTLRVVKSIPLAHLDEAIGLGLRTGFGDDWLRIGGVKMFTDGALGPRTAWMLAGFDTAPDNTGIEATPSAAIREAVLKANAHGLAATVHAIGDRANREILDIYAETIGAGARPAHLRNRIEHVQLLHGDDAGRLAALGVIASMQPLHATSDMVMAEQHWGARTAGAYALRTQLDHGAVLALGSDCPVETLDPLAGIHAAVTRRRADGAPGPDGWHPEQRLTVEEAVRGYTAGPAYAAGLEDRLGSLTPGKWADLTILDQDIFAIDPAAILNTRVLATVVAGRFVWRDPAV